MIIKFLIISNHVFFFTFVCHGFTYGIASHINAPAESNNPPTFKYEKVLYKYIDTLVLDRDFLEYKASKDLAKLLKWIM